MLAGDNHLVEPFQRGQDRIDVFTNPFGRGRVIARWPKLVRVIDKGGRQDGTHALGVGAKGQADSKGNDNGVLAFGCLLSSMSRGPGASRGARSSRATAGRTAAHAELRPIVGRRHRPLRDALQWVAAWRRCVTF